VPTEEVLHDVYYDHRLSRRGEALLLSVTCGRSEVFNLTVELTADERARWEAEGAPFLASLATRIQGDPDRYAGRAL
jgi:hypothetical protein